MSQETDVPQSDCCGEVADISSLKAFPSGLKNMVDFDEV